jgi:hypothetical protein
MIHFNCYRSVKMKESSRWKSISQCKLLQAKPHTTTSMLAAAASDIRNKTTSFQAPDLLLLCEHQMEIVVKIEPKTAFCFFIFVRLQHNESSKKRAWRRQATRKRDIWDVVLFRTEDFCERSQETSSQMMGEWEYHPIPPTVTSIHCLFLFLDFHSDDEVLKRKRTIATTLYTATTTIIISTNCAIPLRNALLYTETEKVAFLYRFYSLVSYFFIFPSGRVSANCFFSSIDT